MEKKTMCENLAREAHEKGGFTGAWLYAEGGVIVSEARIAPDNRFLRNGVLEAEALPEIVSQACAAVTGFEQDDKGLRGMLAGMRNVAWFAPVRAGDVLRIEIRETAQIDQYFNVEFRVLRADGALCATGELAICLLS